ncbi:hypothetical protein ILUMI_02848 [Ignelater luminosus]|uniref:Uncharacterized protein n=1 Tax=Ignelater luminosus TaxID=2038154 RepID=A0A8K0DMZ7_IGNLU|nr:hypothetical protein ILUMI_02848 [Ignelater luminosus]
MLAVDLEELLSKVGTRIKKQDTHLRASISPRERMVAMTAAVLSSRIIRRIPEDDGAWGYEGDSDEWEDGAVAPNRPVGETVI